RRARRRRVGWFVGLLLVLALIAGLLFAAYSWTQTRYFVGADDDTVVIFRGIQQNIGPISLSSVYEDTDVPLDSLTEFDRQTVEGTINAGSLQEAEQIVSNLRTTAGGGG
ncbi:MAG: serine/threonine-protein phosphatase, partial [Microbacterium sp.]|nr:serine/threonine-protein phosphatase [Microbacterium sp.]